MGPEAGLSPGSVPRGVSIEFVFLGLRSYRQKIRSLRLYFLMVVCLRGAGGCWAGEWEEGGKWKWPADWLFTLGRTRAESCYLPSWIVYLFPVVVFWCNQSETHTDSLGDSYRDPVCLTVC